MAKTKTAKVRNGHIYSEVKKTAQITIKCQACAWLQTQDQKTFLNRVTPEELKLIQKAARNNFKIIKGQQYVSQVVHYNGQMVRSSFLPKIFDIVIKYGLMNY